MARIFCSNLPYNCSEEEFKRWAKSFGVEFINVRIVRDLVAGMSPAFGYAEVEDIGSTILKLNLKKMRDLTILVKDAHYKGKIE